MRVWSLLMCCAVLMLVSGGCGPNVTTEDLGQIVFEVPEVTGADKPYDMPELGPAPPRSESPEPGLPPFLR